MCASSSRTRQSRNSVFRVQAPGAGGPLKRPGLRLGSMNQTSVRAVALDPSNPETVHVGTGRGAPMTPYRRLRIRR